MPHIVLKLDGTALSDGAAFVNAVKVIRSNPLYTHIVPSAPAGRDWRMTELLRKLEHVEERSDIYWLLDDHLLNIVRKLDLGRDFENWICAETIALAQHIDSKEVDWAYVASRGEYWSASILARALRIPIVDPTALIKFTPSGEYDERGTRRAFSEASLPEQFVLPGFYGSDHEGKVRLFPKSGSDITAAILAAATAADELHVARASTAGIHVINPGIRTGSPSTLRLIEYMSHEQAACMASRSDCGALHRLALQPVARARIPVRVFNVYEPGKPGTHIVPAGHPKLPKRNYVVGIAERPGFTVFTLKRARVRRRRTLMQSIRSVLSTHGLDFEHEVVGRDAVSFTVRNDALKGRHEEVAKDLRTALRAQVSFLPNEGVICLVGNDLGSDLITLGYLLAAIGTCCGNGAGRPAKEVRLSFLSLTACGTCIMFGVENDTLRTAANRLYDELMRRRR